MAFETRKDTVGRYFTLTVRVGPRKKRRRIYIGRGQLAELAAVLLALRKVRREIRRRALRGFQIKPVSGSDLAGPAPQL